MHGYWLLAGNQRDTARVAGLSNGARWCGTLLLAHRKMGDWPTIGRLLGLSDCPIATQLSGVGVEVAWSRRLRFLLTQNVPHLQQGMTDPFRCVDSAEKRRLQRQFLETVEILHGVCELGELLRELDGYESTFKSSRSPLRGKQWEGEHAGTTTFC